MAVGAAALIHVFAGGVVVASIILRVEEDIVVGSRIDASVAITVALGLPFGFNVAIIVMITMHSSMGFAFLLFCFL